MNFFICHFVQFFLYFEYFCYKRNQDQGFSGVQKVTFIHQKLESGPGMTAWKAGNVKIQFQELTPYVES